MAFSAHRRFQRRSFLPFLLLLLSFSICVGLSFYEYKETLIWSWRLHDFAAAVLSRRFFDYLSVMAASPCPDISRCAIYFLKSFDLPDRQTIRRMPHILMASPPQQIHFRCKRCKRLVAHGHSLPPRRPQQSSACAIQCFPKRRNDFLCSWYI